MKKVIAAFLAFAMAISFAACAQPEDPEKEQLAAPSGLSISTSGLISWQPVEHAEQYVVTIDTTANPPVTETKYQVSSEALKHDFTFSVSAQAEGYLDSPATSGSYTAPALPEVTVSIRGEDEVSAGKTLTLTATVTGTSETDVVWSVQKGSEYAEISKDGKLTAKEVESDAQVVVRAASVADPTVWAEKSITVRAKTPLTQAMLDEIASHSEVEFSGWINVEVYTIGSRPTYTSSTNMTISTAMDGTHWYAQYQTAEGIPMELFYENHEGVASEVHVSLMNDEAYVPMTEDDGTPISWEDSGLYNVFAGVDGKTPLQLSDFTFNDETFRWEYTGADKTLPDRMISSVNPYDFVPTSLALVITDGEIVGITSDAAPDYSIVPGYESRMTLTTLVNFSEVEVPTIGKFEFREDIHTPLQEAIDNMKGLNSYVTEVRQLSTTLGGAAFNYTGYRETVSGQNISFREFNWMYGEVGAPITYNFTGNNYGYQQKEASLYNLYYEMGAGVYEADRAYEGTVAAERPAFGFSPAIFTRYAIGGANDDYDFYYEVADGMGVVTTQFLRNTVSVDDYALLSLYSAVGDTGTSLLRPSITIKDGYITEAQFYYNIGYYSGVIEISYSQFNAVTETPSVSFETKQLPASWSEIVWNSMLDDTEEYYGMTAEEFFAEWLGENVEVPFFGEVLGDTYALGAPLSYAVHGTDPILVAALYYDLELDLDYTLESSMQKVCNMLKEAGFTSLGRVDNSGGYAYEFQNEQIGIAVVDNALDFYIYVWKLR